MSAPRQNPVASHPLSQPATGILVTEMMAPLTLEMGAGIRSFWPGRISRKGG